MSCEGPARPNLKGPGVYRLLDPGLQPHRRGQRDHRAIVGAQGQFGVVHMGLQAFAGHVQLRAQFSVGTHTASDHQTPQAGVPQGRDALAHQHLNDGGLRGGRHVSALGFGQYTAMGFSRVR